MKEEHVACRNSTICNIEVLDNQTNRHEFVIEKTENSFLVTQSKLTDKGIDCNNWFDELRFNKRFTIII